MKISTVFRIEEGLLRGTEIEPILGVVSVRYPHRKTPDLYVPPISTPEKKTTPWHCCQDNCPQCDFIGGLEALIDHLLLHKGKLLKPWTKKAQLVSPRPAIRIPSNDWEDLPKHGTGVNADRRLVVHLYIDKLKRALRKQGIEVIEGTP